MAEKEIDKEIFVKYCAFFNDYGTRLLNDGDFESQFDTFMRDYALFLQRVMKSKRVSQALKNDIRKIFIPGAMDTRDDGPNFTDIFINEIPLLGKFNNFAKRQDKIEKIQQIAHGLSSLQFKVEEYFW
jgi:hypothetical protein